MEGEIIGITKDFHYSSLHQNVGPLAMAIPRALIDNVFIKYSSENDNQYLESLRLKWAEIFPDQPFDYSFLESNIDGMYAKDNHFAYLIYVFSIISFIISCIGLYGIVEFHVQRKLKEVSLRKVMGASVFSIFSMLSRGLWAWWLFHC